MGEAPEAIILVETIADVDQLQFEPVANSPTSLKPPSAWMMRTKLSTDSKSDSPGLLARLKKTSAMPRKIAKKRFAS